jgi:hypothetical protein
MTSVQEKQAKEAIIHTAEVFTAKGQLGLYRDRV